MKIIKTKVTKLDMIKSMAVELNSYEVGLLWQLLSRLQESDIEILMKSPKLPEHMSFLILSSGAAAMFRELHLSIEEEIGPIDRAADFCKEATKNDFTIEVKKS